MFRPNRKADIGLPDEIEPVNFVSDRAPNIIYNEPMHSDNEAADQV